MEANSRTPLKDLIGKLDTLLLDLDGTLLHSQPGPDEALLDYAVSLGVQDGDERRRRAARWAHFYWAQSPELAQDITTFQGLTDPFWINYAVRSLRVFDCTEECARDLAPDICRYMEEEYQPEDVVPPDVPVTLEAFQSAGYHLGVLSNRSQSCQEDLERLGLSTFFELALVSAEVGFWKPDPRIFHCALERMKSTPGRAAYVGDNYYADVIGAQRASIQAVLFDPMGIFPEANCPVIQRIGDLCALI